MGSAEWGMKTVQLLSKMKGDGGMDSNGYPDEHELETMREWPMEKGYQDLMEYIEPKWQYGDIGYFAKKGNVYKLSTAGWSGNEDIIQALQENLTFWGCCWLSSRRGGHHEFRINRP